MDHFGGKTAVLLTGARGAGKTTICLDLAASSRRFAGLVCPAMFGGSGMKVGFLARCLETGESWDLARSDRDLGGPRTGRFSFSRAGLDRAVACLRRALGRGDRVVIVDEIGPLELECGEGFAPVLPLLADAGDMLLVVRPELAAALAALLPRHAVETVRVAEGERDAAAREVQAAFGPGGPLARADRFPV